jgi:hypothetical protein
VDVGGPLQQLVGERGAAGEQEDERGDDREDEAFALAPDTFSRVPEAPYVGLEGALRLPAVLFLLAHLRSSHISM